MNLSELIARKSAELDTAKGRQRAAIDRYNQIANRLGEIRNMPTVTATVEDEIVRLKSEKDQRDREANAQTDVIERLTGEYAELRAEQIADEKIDAAGRQSTPTPAAHTRANAQEGTVTTAKFSVRSPRTYSAERAFAGDSSFIRDLFAAHRGDPDAAGRLSAHGNEARVEQTSMVERAVNTGGVAAFVPPQYLVEMFADALRAGRPLGNIMNRSIPLPEEGMTVNVPRITTGSLTAVQAAQNTSVGTQDIDDTTLAIPVATIAGYVDVSRQSLERGRLVEQMVLGDLAADYAARLDVQLINGSGAAGQHLGVLGTAGINAVTYSDASPTLAELWPKLSSAIGLIQSTRFTGPSHILMAPATWAWILSTLGTDGRPLVTGGDAGPTNTMGVAVGTDYGSGVGTLQGVPVVLDGNIPANLGAGTNETRIIVGDFRDAFLMEENDGVPVQLRFEDVGSANLTTRLLAYGYSAATFGRQPSAASVISGTGLITPAL